MSDMVGNPEDWFSHVAAHILTMSVSDQFKIHELHQEKISILGFMTKSYSNTNLAVQPQKITIKGFWVKKGSMKQNQRDWLAEWKLCN